MLLSLSLYLSLQPPASFLFKVNQPPPPLPRPNIGVEVFESLLSTFRFTSRSGIARSFGNSLCNFLWDHQSVFLSPPYISTSNAQGFQFLHFLANTCLFVFFFFWWVGYCHPHWYKWHLTVVFTCTTLMASDVENAFMGLLAICVSSLEKCLYSSALLFFNWI